MKARSLCMRYADVLFFFASKKKEWEDYLFQLEEIAKLSEGSIYLQKAFMSPLISGQAKAKVLERLFKGKIKEEVLLFLEILAKRKRFSLLPHIIEQFALKVKKQKGILPVKLITAQKIDPEDKSLLQKKLQAEYNKQIELSEEQSRQVIGGMILVFPDHKILDQSLKARLEHLRMHLRKGKRHAA